MQRVRAAVPAHGRRCAIVHRGRASDGLRSGPGESSTARRTGRSSGCCAPCSAGASSTGGCRRAAGPSRSPASRWIGGSTVLLEHDPTLDMPRNKFRTERIQLGSSRVDLYVEPREMRAEIDLEVDETTQHRGRGVAPTAAEYRARTRRVRGQRRRPIRGHQGAAPAGAGDRSRGRAPRRPGHGGRHARRSREFNGDFQLRDGRLELYRTNLIADRRCRLTARSPATSSRSRRRQDGQAAPLDVDGNFGWPQGVMTGTMRLQGDELLVADTPDFRILASPDIALHAGKDGFRSTAEVRIPTASIAPTRADEHRSHLAGRAHRRGAGHRGRTSRPRPRAYDSQHQGRARGGGARRSYGLKARLGGDVTVLDACPTTSRAATARSTSSRASTRRSART